MQPLFERVPEANQTEENAAKATVFRTSAYQ
jgi:hypothetical protein